MPALHTPRLFLRSFDHNILSDYDNLIAVYSSSLAIEYNGDQGYRTHTDVIEKEAAGSVDPALCEGGEISCPKWCTFLVFLKTSGQFIGIISMMHRRPMIPDLGYNFIKEFTNQGYGTEAAKEVLRFWREDIGLREIWIGTFPTNTRSQRIAEKLGFVPGGIVTGRFPPSSSVGITEVTAFVLPHMDPFPKELMFDLQPTQNLAEMESQKEKD